MGNVRNFKAARNVPTPDERSSWNFRLWSYGFMRPLHAIPQLITVNNAYQPILRIFIPANIWADFKRLIIWADVGYHQNGGPHPGGRQLLEAQNLQGIGPAQRGAPAPIANSVLDTRYVIQRQYQLEAGGLVYEENWDIQGNTTMAAAANVDHRVTAYNPVAGYDRTLDAYLDILLANTFAGSTDRAVCHTAQAFIQAPLDIKRFPQ
jgi:hypothetical protein